MKNALLFTLGSLMFSQVANADSFTRELAAIRFIESSDGYNLNHALITYGMHKGTRAGGEYGIMPITAREALLRSKKSLKIYRGYASLDDSKLTQALNTNKDLDKSLAKYMWARLRQRFTAEQAACAWFRGPYAESCQDLAALENDDYVQKFRSTIERLNTVIVSNP